MDIKYREVTRSVKAKSGKIYTYKKLIPIRLLKGERRISKSGKHYNFYGKRLGSRNGVKFGFARYSRIFSTTAKERDNFTCQICGVQNTKFHIHHLDNMGQHLSKSPNNDISNLQTLCVRCHLRLHSKFTNKLNAILELRREGLTLAEIGTLYAVSRQRIHQILLNNKYLT